MILESKLDEIKERYLHAYRSMREFLENVDPEKPKIDFYSKMRIQRVMALDRIDNSLEVIAMDLAWIVQRIKHPIKIYRWLRELEEG